MCIFGTCGGSWYRQTEDVRDPRTFSKKSCMKCVGGPPAYSLTDSRHKNAPAVTTEAFVFRVYMRFTVVSRQGLEPRTR